MVILTPLTPSLASQASTTTLGSPTATTWAARTPLATTCRPARPARGTAPPPGTGHVGSSAGTGRWVFAAVSPALRAALGCGHLSLCSVHPVSRCGARAGSTPCHGDIGTAPFLVPSLAFWKAGGQPGSVPAPVTSLGWLFPAGRRGRTVTQRLPCLSSRTSPSSSSPWSSAAWPRATRRRRRGSSSGPGEGHPLSPVCPLGWESSWVTAGLPRTRGDGCCPVVQIWGVHGLASRWRRH